jgi:hypothetical protein
MPTGNLRATQWPGALVHIRPDELGSPNLIAIKFTLLDKYDSLISKFNFPVLSLAHFDITGLSRMDSVG